jgi:hypothetical protein
MTQTSKSQARSVAAIGNGCVIPAKAGIHFSNDHEDGFPRTRE